MRDSYPVVIRETVLKWAGNKRKMGDEIRTLVGGTYPGWIEPFVGGGGFLASHPFRTRVVIGDLNKDLTELYKWIKLRPLTFIEEVKRAFDGGNVESKYYERRDMFNNMTHVLPRSVLFLYLNRHGFNGLCRYNKSGGYNVPFGKYKNVVVPIDQIEIVSEILQHDSYITRGNFTDTMDMAEEGDAIYCDPPYVPASITSNFTSYTGEGFNIGQQKTLHRAAVSASKRGVTVAVSNSYTPTSLKIFGENSEVHELSASRSISCDGGGRGSVKEYLFVYRPQ
jgi:DNA adenine methylase